MQTSDGVLVILAGKSRSGKTAYTAQAVAKDKRVIAWDPDGQWCKLPGWKKITTQRELLREVTHPASARQNKKIAYVVDDELSERFNFFSTCAHHWLEFYGPCSVIAEELADVSSSGKAPGHWGTLVRRGLKLGMRLYAISQRWAEADKTAFNNISEIVCFSMLPMDVDYMAKRTGLDRVELAALRKVETATTITCPYVRLIWDSNQVIRNKLVFRKKVK